MKKRVVYVALLLVAAALAVTYNWHFSDVAKLKRLGDEFLVTNSSKAGSALSEAAIKAGPEATPILLELLRNPKLKTPGYVIDALGELGPAAKAAVPDLIVLMEKERWHFGYTFPQGRRSLLLTDLFSALGKIKDERAIAPLCSVISGPYSYSYINTDATIDALTAALVGFGPAAKEAIPTLLRFARILLLSPANGSTSGDTVTFIWAYKGVPGAAYCPTVITDKGQNPFDDWHTDKFPAKKNAVSLTRKLIWYDGRFEWGVEVWACLDQNVDCSAERPRDCVLVRSKVRSLQVR